MGGLAPEAARRREQLGVRLEPHPSSVAAARRGVRQLLERTGRDDLAESATLLVSEVVTNALLHAGTEIEVAARFVGQALRVEVGDGSPHLPSRRRYAATAGTGRGLLMLESMVDDWGVAQRDVGKVVWFVLSSGDHVVEATAARPTADDRAGTSDRVPGEQVAVELRNMPLLLHAAWQEHAETLLRELLLASLDEDGEDPVQVHAEATDAIAVLEEHIPRTGAQIPDDALMAGAVEPEVSVPMVRVPVPQRSVRHFDTLDRAIEAAIGLSKEGLVLAPPPQPEIQAFRHWMCQQVLRQADGDQPEPWLVPADGRRELRDIPGWDATVVTRSQTGVIAADESSQIVAVSREAAAVLGYDDPDELLGRRIVSIVPTRFRQAHVAGFTMYLLARRRPLLDRPVVVPALRRDGSEVPVELLIRELPVEQGQTVLLADIRLAPS